MPPPWDPIDHLLALDPGRRGIAAFFARGGAAGAARALLRARRVLIATGFTVAAGAPETDGPPGAAVLGHALGQLGARVRYVTDPAGVPVVQSALALLGARAEVFPYPEGNCVAPALLRRERPTHMIAIERPGRNRDGDYLNARGASVAAWNRPIDELFVHGRAGARPISTRGARPAPRAVTIGVGDGGNEIGMGNAGARLARLGPLMARIASVVRTDHLVVSGVSNWGAYGIAAALERLTGRALLHTPEVERRLVEACVAAGAVDGLSRRHETTVDALDLDVHQAFVRLLSVAARSGGKAASAMMEAGRRASARPAQRSPMEAGRRASARAAQRSPMEAGQRASARAAQRSPRLVGPRAARAAP